MLELGQSLQFDDVRVTSPFPPITAVKRTSQHFRKVPTVTLGVLRAAAHPKGARYLSGG
jgi:hypothetical protein